MIHLSLQTTCSKSMTKLLRHSYLELIKTSFHKGLFHLLGSNFLVQFLGFGLVLFLAKYLSVGEVGNLKLLHSYIALFILIGCFGFNSSILKFCSEDVSKLERLGCFNHGIKRVILLSAFSFILLLCFNFFYLIPNHPELNPWAYYYGFSILFAPPALLFMSYMQSQQKVKLAAKLQVLVRTLFVFLIFLSALFFGFPGVIISTVGSYLVGLLIYYPFIKKELTFQIKLDRYEVIDKYSLYVFMGAVITVVAQNIDIYLLDFMGVESKGIGVYSVATLFFLSGTVVTGTIQTIVTPYFSKKQADLYWVRTKAIFYQKRLIVFSIFTSISLMVLSNILVAFYFGVEYQEAIILSYVLILKYFIWSCFCIYGAVLFSIGVIKEGIYISLIILVINIILSLILYPQFGVIGIAISQVMSSIIQFGFVIWLFNLKTEENLSAV